MGRNAGSKIFWSHAYDGSEHISSNYCQQHATFKILNHATFNGAMLTLKSHISTDHGNAEQ